MQNGYEKRQINNNNKQVSKPGQSLKNNHMEYKGKIQKHENPQRKGNRLAGSREQMRKYL